MSSDCFGVVNDIAPTFRPFVQNLYQELKLGLCKSKVEIEKLTGGSGFETNFRITLPYCSKKLKWEVLFDRTVPWFAPDFRFDDDTFLNNIDEDYLEEKVPSLNNWNECDPTALSKVITELVNLYKHHQLRKLNEDESSRACFEYSALLGALASENDIEVWVGGHIVEFLIKLNVDTTGLPELYNKDIMNDQNPGVDTALLLVRYPNSTNAELILSPLLSKSLGNITLPLMHQTGVLMDYVPMVTDLLNEKIKELLNNEKLKREILAMMIVKYEGAILEHDASSASFLFATNDFHWILHVEVDPKFLEKPPVITLRSVYHSSKGKPKFKVLPSCPYNNFEVYIEQQVEIFKNECKGIVTNNQLVNIET